MADKRISQLNSHTTPSGSDLLVIVNNNETKKITYEDLKDSIVINSDNALLNAFSASYLNDSASFHTRINAATNEQDLSSFVTQLVVNTLSGSVDGRLDSLEGNSGSYETKGRGILSGSISYTSLTNIPSGIISQSTDLSLLNSFTQSIDGRVDNLESWSSSLDSTFATDLQVSIVSSSVAATIGVISQNTGLVSTSSFNSYTASQSTASLVSRLGILESNTGSYLTSLNGTISGSSQLTGSYDGRYVLSGSITQTTWDNISGKPTGLVSQSVDITSLNSFTASYFTDSASIDSRITTEKGRVDAILSASTADVDTFAEIVTLINSVDTTNDNAFATYYTSSNARIGSLESVTSSYETKGRGIVSGSSQLTSSFDTRYTLSGSVQPLPSNLVSSSAQITAFGFISSSQTIDTGSFATTSSLNTLSSSVDSRLDTLEASIISGSTNYTQVLGNRRTSINSIGTSIISGSITTSGNPVQIMVTGDANPIGGSSFGRLQIFRDGNGIGNVIQVENSSNLNVPYCLNVIDTPSAGTYTYSMRTVDSMSGTFDFGEFTGPLLTAVELKSNTQLPSGLISGSSQLTASYDTRYTLSGSVQPLPSNLISGSSQLTSSFEVRGSGIYSSSAQLPNGLISGSSQLPIGLVSGSSQLTSSYDTRYTLSGSVVSGTTPAGTISGSAQISAFGFVSGSYTTTASFNSFTASAQSVTTGSNSFNGTQTITGSLNVTSGNIIASSITANTSSLYLTSGSNLYVQNNGLVEITGSLVITGSVNIISTTALQIGTGSGDEGGEILLVKSQTNNSLTGSGITIDSYQNKIRIFEQGGNARGVSIDLSKTPNGVGGELLWKAGGLVNADVDVTLGNLKARIPSTGNRSLQLSTVSGTYSVYGSGVYSFSGISGTTINSGAPLSITTTPAYIIPSYNFTVAGAIDTWTLMDTSAGIAWRITMIIGASYNNNMISIERLV